MKSEFVNLVPPELRVSEAEVIEYLIKRLKLYVGEYSRRPAGVLGVSGGVDSSVVAYLATRAIGLKNVHMYLLPSESTPEEDMEDALAVLKKLRVPQDNVETIPIDKHVTALASALGDRPNEKLTIGNIKARVRMILLHGFAQIHKALVLGTGDKSEITVGYFTKFGDGGVDILPLGDLYKSQVRQLAAFIGLPERVYRKAPSPALWEGQSAESELGIDYFLLDRILFHRFDLWWDEESTASKLAIPVEQVKRVVQLVKKTQHKRYSPEIFRLSFRSHGSDWRYPREWA